MQTVFNEAVSNTFNWACRHFYVCPYGCNSVKRFPAREITCSSHDCEGGLLFTQRFFINRCACDGVRAVYSGEILNVRERVVFISPVLI